MSGGAPEDLLRAAQAVADGEPLPDADIGGDSRLRRNFEQLQALQAAFARHASGGEAASSPPPRHWKHLELIEAIGSGGFGEVYRAFDPVLQREVALKLRRADAAGRDDPQEWIREARRLARVRHPHVLAVHGADVDAGRVGLWADLVRGESLEARLQRAGPLPAGPLLDLAVPLADALRAVHDAGIVHGDVKTTNVMLDEHARVVLMDFGAASEVGAELSPRAGSPAAMAPDQLSGGPPTPATHAYAFGELLFRLATGAWPDRSGPLVDGDGVEPLQQRVRLPRACSRLVDRLRAARADARPTLAQAADELRRIVAAPARRRRTAALAVTIVSLALGAGAAGVGYWRASTEAVRAERARVDAENANRFLRDVLGAPKISKLGRQARVDALLDAALPRLEREFAPDTATGRMLRATLGGTALSLDRHAEAEALLRTALDSYEAHCATCDAAIVDTRATLARAVWEQGRHVEADALLEAAMPRLARLPPDSPHQAVVRARRGEIALDRGDLAAAAPWIDAAWKLRDAVAWDYPQDAVVVWMARHNLLNARAEFAAAEQAARDMLAWGGTLDTAAPQVESHARGALGQALARQSRHAEAEAEFRSAHATAVAHVGETDVHAVGLLTAIGNALSGQGRHAEAAGLHAQALDLGRAGGGLSRSDEITLLVNVGAARLEAGEFAAARPVLQEAYDTASAEFGDNGRLTLLLRVNLAELALFSDDIARARELAESSVVGLANVFGERHPFTLVAGAIAAGAQLRQGDAAAAIARLEPIVPALAGAVGGEASNVANARAWLGEAYLTGGDAARARPLLEAAHAYRLAHLGAGDPRTRRVHALLNKAGD